MKDVEGEVAIGVVRNQENRYLLMRRSESNSSSGKWTFPGGKIEKSEEPSEAAVREIREETNLKTTAVHVGETYLNEGELGWWKIHPVLLELKNDEYNLKMNHEHDKYQWIDLNQLENFDTLGEMKAPEKLGLEK